MSESGDWFTSGFSANLAPRMNDYLPTPSMALAAYLERFVEGRRVIVFGDSTSGLASHLLDRGARLVHVYDADVSRVAEATARSDSQSVTYAPYGQSGVAVRDGAFDLGVIENLSLAEDTKDLVRRLRRALSARGIAVIATPNPDAEHPLIETEHHEEPSYYELYDRVAEEFDEIKMLGQTPFVGYAVADFGPEADDSVSLDTAFVPGGAEEPDYYVALASHFPLDNDAFSVVQLPLSELRATAQYFSPVQPQGADHSELEAQLAAARDAATKAEARSQTAEQELSQLKQADAALTAELEELRAEIKKRDSWLEQLESRATTADERADDAETKLEALRVRHKTQPARQPTTPKSADESSRIEQLQAALRDKEAELLEKEAEFADKVRELEEAKQQSAKAEKQLLKHDEKLEKLEDKLQAAKKKASTASDAEDVLQKDLSRLEEQLIERGHEIQRLERELSRTGRWAAGLAEELRALQQDQEEPAVLGELNSRIESLAENDARRVADLAAAQWTIQQLEARLSER